MSLDVDRLRRRGGVEPPRIDVLQAAIERARDGGGGGEDDGGGSR